MFDAGGDRRADRERAGVVERAVAEVLDEVLVARERREPDPLRALAAHLRHAEQSRRARPRRARPSCGSRSRAPTSGSSSALRRAVVRAARAEVRRRAASVGSSAAPAMPGQGREAGARLRRKQVGREATRPSAAPTSSALDRPAHGSRQRPPSSSRLPSDARRAGTAVERLLELRLEEGRACPRRRGPPRRRGEPRSANRASSGQGMPSFTSRMPSRWSSGSSRPRLSSARSTAVVRHARRDDRDPRPVGLEAIVVEARCARVRVQRAPGARSSASCSAVSDAGGEEHRRRSRWRAIGAGMPVAELGERRRWPLASAMSVTIFRPGPQAGRAREGDRVQAEVEHLLHGAGGEQRHQRGCGTSARRRSASSRTCTPGRRRSARPRRRAARSRDVAVADRVGRAVEARVLAVPDADHAVVACARQLGRAAACRRRRSPRAPRSAAGAKTMLRAGSRCSRARAAPGRGRRAASPGSR